MSKRRKNAGAGYGYMFHGAFKEKKDAVAKERKTKGAWIKPTLTNNGYRYIVMSPRTNPRKKKAKPPTPNPMDLMVMGANPEPQEIVARPGQTITIRVNPEARENLYFGFGRSEPSRKELAASRRQFKASVRRRTKEERADYSRLRRSARDSFRGKKKLQDLFHEVYGANPGARICGAKIGGELCTRKPGHCGPHLPQGATMRPQSRHNCKPRGNPSAEAIRESFTGREADHISTRREPHMPEGDYAQLGKLLALYVKPLLGGQVQMIKPRGTLVVSDESARQLWFVGGDQDIMAALGVFGARQRSAGLFELGEARRIDYKQRKEHVPNPDVDEWRHGVGKIQVDALLDFRLNAFRRSQRSQVAFLLKEKRRQHQEQSDVFHGAALYTLRTEVSTATC
jgi:hypothetical protein